MVNPSQADCGNQVLVLLRHGESIWNRQDVFAGWVDVDLTEAGAEQARCAGLLIRKFGLLPDVVHTSVLRRAIRTAHLALLTAERSWIPARRSWRLNERHYGALQGRDKATVRAAYGEEQFMLWRRSYAVAPPPIELGSTFDQTGDPRYADIQGRVPRTESLGDVAERLLPYWSGPIIRDLQGGRTVLVVAHGNSLRSLIRHLDGLSEQAVVELDVPTGVPLVYRLDRESSLPAAPARYLT